MPRLLLALCFIAASGVDAQQDIQFTRFLVPLVDQGAAAGAYGSQWEVRTWVYNDSSAIVAIGPPAYCIFECLPLTGLIPYRSSPTYFAGDYTGNSPAVLFHVDSRYADAVSFDSRIRDVSRGESAGTEIPVVREDRLKTTSAELINVPLAPGFRIMLRVYALPETPAPAVTVRYFRLDDPPSSEPCSSPKTSL